MKYRIPQEFKRVVSLINPDKFVADMADIGEINNISGNYSNDVRFLCNNAIVWILKQLINSSYVYQIEVVEGYFDSYEHAWIKAGNYYLDITLAQFVDCPNIVISKIGEIKGYKEITTYKPFDWLKRQG